MIVFLVTKTNVCYNDTGDNMKIEKIKKTKNGKYKIEFDNQEKMLTYDDVILKNHLLFDKNVDSTILNQINRDTEYYDVYNKLIKMITTKLRSKKEIYEYLDKRMINREDQETIVQKLTELGLVNDQNFCKAYASDRLYLSSDGPSKIKNDLYHFGIDEGIIEEVIASLNEEDIEEKLRKIIAKKIQNNHKHSSYMLKQKLLMELVNNGFDRDLISSIYDELDSGTSNILEREYQKLYQKLSRKYEGKELYHKIKEKLYQKGFDSNEINQYLSKIDIN